MPENEDSEKVIMYSYVKITLYKQCHLQKPYKTLKERRILEQKFTFNKGFFLFFQEDTIVYRANLIIRKYSLQ